MRPPQQNQVARMIAYVATCTSPPQLRQIATNAARAGLPDLETTALRRLYAVLPEAQPGTLAHDVWRSIHALEGTLSRERGRTTLLSRTRQKIGRDGEHTTVRDLVLKWGESEGFTMLVARGMADLTFEAVALRHADQFETSVLTAARQRLSAFGITPPDAG